MSWLATASKWASNAKIPRSFVELSEFVEGGGGSVARSRPTRISLQVYTFDDVAAHTSGLDDCWIVVGDGVYDVSEFVETHPGGAQQLLREAKDSKPAMEAVGHSKRAYRLLERYRIGSIEGGAHDIDEESGVSIGGGGTATADQSVPSPMWAMLPKAMVLFWGASVAFQFFHLHYPSPGWLFHLHTLFAIALVVGVVFAASSAIQGRPLDPAPARAASLQRHKWGMLAVTALSGCTAATMVVKKAYTPHKGLLLLSRRMPSLHSGAALSWIVLVGALAISGLVIYTGGRNSAAIKLCVRGGAGSEGGNVRRKLRSVHRLGGQAATALVLGVAALGLGSHVTLAEAPLRIALAWFLVPVWLALWLPAWRGSALGGSY